MRQTETPTQPQESVIVRPAEMRDLDSILDLIRGDEFAREHSPETLRNLLTHQWMPEAPHTPGFVLVHGERIIGYVGTIYAVRRLMGQSYTLCNLTTLCLHPDYQGRKRRGTEGGGLRYTKLLGDAVLHSGPFLVTAFSANRAAARLLEGLGFQRISERRIVFRPGASLRTLLAGGARIFHDADRILPHLNDEHRQILRDHLPWGCGHHLIVAGDRYCYIVTKRCRLLRSVLLGNWPTAHIRKQYFHASEILFLSDPELAFRHWERLKWGILVRDRTLALAADELILGPGAPQGHPIPRPVHAYGLKVEPRLIDKLYSELILLPY